MNKAVTPFSFILANSTLANQRVQFELQFNLLQNSMIRRHNEKVEEVTQTPLSLQRKIDDLSKRQQSLINSLPSLQEFRQGSLNTSGAMEGIFDEITTLFSTFNGDATVDADEVAAFEAQRDIVADKINNLFVFSHPDINNASAVANLKADVKAIRELTLVVGPLTDNKAVSDTLTSLQNEVNIGITITQNLASTALDLEQKIQAQFASVEADLFKLTAEEQARREDKIASMETDLGNLLRAISISFEINSGMSQVLINRLKPLTPPPGSAVNILS